MEYLVQVAIALLLPLILSMVAYRLGMMTVGGSIASFIIGAAVGIFGSIEWLILMVAFTALGLTVTKLDFEKKKAEGLQEGIHGERGWKNVLGVGLPPCIISIVSCFAGADQYDLLSFSFISCMCVSAADTVASEIGIRDKKVWMITNFKRVEPGINGGISVLGTVTSLIASFMTAIIGSLLIFQTIEWLIIIPTIAGFAGNLLDSLVGALLENKGYISKYANNFSTSLMGAVISAVLYTALV